MAEFGGVSRSFGRVSSELAMRIFPCFLPEDEKVQHYFSVQNQNGPFVGEAGFCLLSCYGNYAYVVAKLLRQYHVNLSLWMK